MRSLLFLVVTLICTTACSNLEISLQRKPTPTLPPLVVDETPSPPESATACSPASIVFYMLDFVDAYNAGDVEQFLSFIDDSFVTFSDIPFDTTIHSDGTVQVVPAPGSPPYEAIETYVQQRMDQNDRLELRMVEVVPPPWGPEEDSFQVVFFLSRQADDLGPESVPHLGQGLVRCVLDAEHQNITESEIVIWVIGRPITERAHLCTTVINPVLPTGPVSQVPYCVRE